jgi:hypothetical protein
MPAWLTSAQGSPVDGSTNVKVFPSRPALGVPPMSKV